MRAVLAAIVGAAWLAIYLPDTGRGFIKDDFHWLVAAPLAPSPWDAAWTAATGFFRPLVSLSFTANHALSGLQPLGYGLTNLALALASALLIFLLARAFGLGQRGGMIAAGIWLFTPHGMDMAVIWVSGRVALLLVVFVTAACWAAARGHLVVAAVLAACALLSKEEAVIAPVLVAIVMGTRAHGRAPLRLQAMWAAASAVLLGMYFSLRAASGAMTPWSAPDEYRYRLDPVTLLENGWQYLDRLATFPLLICAIVWALTRGAAAAPCRIPLMTLGLVWAAIAMIPTIGLPVRSSLYVLLPLVGTSLAAAAFVEGRLSATGSRQRRHVAIAVVLIAIAAVPIYRSRQREWSDAARLSARVTAEAPALFRDVPDGARVFLNDWPEQPNLESTFGALMPEMLRITTGKSLVVTRSREEAEYSVLLAPVPRQPAP